MLKEDVIVYLGPPTFIPILLIYLYVFHKTFCKILFFYVFYLNYDTKIDQFYLISGAVGLVLFGALNAGILYVYFWAFQAVDEEEFGGAWELTKEGFMTSFATFMVIWIILYTGLHFD